MMRFIAKINVRQWALFSLLNLSLVAILGLLMRLKIMLPMPYVNQKFMLHAHSHFAFSGWVSHILMVLMVAAIFSKKRDEALPSRYQGIVWANLLTAYGMLITFAIQGYTLYSIVFSSLTVLISYIFAVVCWWDMRRSNLCKQVRRWFGAALVFLVLSSIGTFYLAYLMSSNNADPRLQLGAVYFFLHFQYNGWFFFACMGLLHYWLHTRGVRVQYERLVLRIFAWACVPTYFLSILWWKAMPQWLYVLVVMSVILSVLAWSLWLRSVWATLSKWRALMPMMTKWLLCGVAIATCIKFLLQALSVIPSLSQLAYSFRPVVIAYLHLVLLGIITLFILGYLCASGSMSTRRITAWFMGIFVLGVVCNELFLMIQGMSGLFRSYIDHIPLALVGASATMVVGLGGVFWSQLVGPRE